MLTEEQKFRRSLAVGLTTLRQLDREAVATFSYAHLNRGLNDYLQMIPQLPHVIRELQHQFRSPLLVHDAGCGTGRAAAELAKKFGVDVTGSTLVPVSPTFLPKDNIHICRSCRVKGSFHLILAVGSLNVSDTILSDGPDLLRQLIPGGYFILVENTNPTRQPSEEGFKFMEMFRKDHRIIHGSAPFYSHPTYHYIFQRLPSDIQQPSVVPPAVTDGNTSASAPNSHFDDSKPHVLQSFDFKINSENLEQDEHKVELP